MTGRWLIVAASWCALASAEAERPMEYLRISGIYPHLCAFNQPEPGIKDPSHGEVGIGAMVPWAGRLWYLTYPQHKRTGSNDKLYEVDENLHLTIRPESVGGTHACRMIHRESNQLILGPYFIDSERNVRVADLQQLDGRLTAVMRHLTDPAHKVYFLDMEGKFYEVDVHTLAVKLLFVKPVPGWHAKGGYTAQGRVVIANNGESRGGGGGTYADLLVGGPPEGPEDIGCLAEWDGQTWRILERRQFLDVTGPGGLEGAPDDETPLWTFGWDKRSLLLKLLDHGVWHTFRLPKASHTYDPAHGYFTEWPRIREIEPGKPAMTAHGGLFDFPLGFRAGQTGGIRQINSYVRYIPDIGHWRGEVILTADDSAMMGNPLCGQAESNLWFGTRAQLDEFGPKAGWGGVWLDDLAPAGQPSLPFLIGGWRDRTVHLAHRATDPVRFNLEVDRTGAGRWEALQTVEVPAGGYIPLQLPVELAAEWLRFTVDRDCVATAYLHLHTPRPSAPGEDALFACLPPATQERGYSTGIIRPSAVHRGLEWACRTVGETVSETAQIDLHYEPPATMRWAAPAEDRIPYLERVGAFDRDFEVDAASVIVTDAQGGRWRLPKGSPAYDKPWPTGWPRGVRECVSERFLANIHGTFYEVPRWNHDAVPRWQQCKPVATHNRRITDFCTWRGLWVLAGARLDAVADGHFYGDEAGRGVWLGAFDDIWKFGKPVGFGGPWRDTAVRAGEPSDPYLLTNYDRKRLTLTSATATVIRAEVMFDHTTGWHPWRAFTVAAGQTVEDDFPAGFQAHWIRFVAAADTTATALLRYD